MLFFGGVDPIPGWTRRIMLSRLLIQLTNVPVNTNASYVKTRIFRLHVLIIFNIKPFNRESYNASPENDLTILHVQ